MPAHTKDTRVIVYKEEIYGAGCSGGTRATPQPVTQALINAGNINFYAMNFIKSDATFPLKEYERQYIDGPSLGYGARLEVNKSYNFKECSFPMLNQSGAIDWLTESLTGDFVTNGSWGMHIEHDGKVFNAYGLVPKKYTFKMNNNDLHDETVDFFYYDAAETGSVISGIGQLETGNAAYWWKDGWITLDATEVTGFKELELRVENMFDEDLAKAGNPLLPYLKTKNVEIDLTYRGDSPSTKWDLLSETSTKYAVILARNSAQNNFSGTKMTVSTSENNTIAGEKGFMDSVVTFKATTGSTFSTS